LERLSRHSPVPFELRGVSRLSSPAPQSTKTLSPIRALRRSTTSWPTAWQRHVGFASYSWSYTAPCCEQLWSTATTSASSTTPTQFSWCPSTSAPSLLRLISTSSMSVLPSGTFGSSTSQRLPSSLTSSPRGCPPRCSRSFSPISTFAVATISTTGGLECGYMWGAMRSVIRVVGPLCVEEAQPLVYKYVLLSLGKIEQSFSLPNRSSLD
jgi:hypothetical protein